MFHKPGAVGGRDCEVHGRHAAVSQLNSQYIAGCCTFQMDSELQDRRLTPAGMHIVCHPVLHEAT